MAPASRLSGLQKDVLSLYRRLLREALRKDRNSSAMSHRSSTCELLAPESQSSTSHARERFRKEALSVRRSDFKTIEYQLRKGEKMVKLLRMPGVDVVGGA